MPALSKSVLIIAPDETAGPIAYMLGEIGLSRAESDLLTTPEHLVRILQDNQYKLILASQPYFGAAGPRWHRALRSLAPDSDLVFFNDGEPVAETTPSKDPDRQDARSFFLPGQASLATIREVIEQRIPAARRAGSGTLAALDYRRQRVCQNTITQLEANVDAHAVYLVDNLGMVVASSGQHQDLPISEIGSLLGGSFSALLEVGRLAGEPEPGPNLIYRQGIQDDLYALNIDGQFSLILLVARSDHAAKLGTVWYYLRQAAHALEESVAQLVAASPTGMFSERATQDLDAALEELEKSEGGFATNELVSLDEAIAHGLVGTHFEQEQ